MHQGLIAQWHRGIASKGFIGALLLVVPVMVAATIGFGGGVGAGLSSLATGPSETTLGEPSAQTETRSIEQLTTTLPQLTIDSARREGGGGSGTETELQFIETPTVTTQPGGDSDPGGGQPGGSGTTEEQSAPAPDQGTGGGGGNGGSGGDVAIPVNNPVDQLVGGLGQGSLGIGE